MFGLSAIIVSEPVVSARKDPVLFHSLKKKEAKRMEKLRAVVVQSLVALRDKEGLVRAEVVKDRV